MIEMFRLWQALPRAVWLLMLARGLNQLGAFTLPFLTVLLIQRLGIAVTVAGALMALFGAASIPSRIIGGHLADLIGYRSTIVVGLTGTAIAQVALVSSTSLLTAALSILFFGLMYEIYEPPSQALLADIDPENRPSTYGLYSTVLAVAGLLAGLLGAAVGRIDLAMLFIIDAVTSVVCAVIIWIGLKVPERGARSRVDEPSAPSPWRDPAMLAMLVVGTGFASAYFQVNTIMPLTLRGRGIDPAMFGLLLAVSTLTIAVGQPLLARTGGSARDPFREMRAGYLLLGVGFLAAGVAGNLWQFVAATVLWSVGSLLLLAQPPAVVAGISPIGARGRYMSVYGLSWGLAAMIGPFAGTQSLARLGIARTWTIIAVVCVLFAASLPLVARIVNRPVRP